MAFMEELGNQVRTEFSGKGTKVTVALLNGQNALTGVVFTAQRDYLQLDEADGTKRFTIPYTAIAYICAA